MVSDDPIRALQGAYTSPGPPSEVVRALERATEQEIEERRQGRLMTRAGNDDA